MVTYILLFLISAISLFTAYWSIHLFLNARGSQLYATSSMAGVLSTLFFMTVVLSYFVEYEMITLFCTLILSATIFTLYHLWRVTYNRMTQKTYTLLIIVLLLIQITSSTLVCFNKDEFLPLLKTISETQLLNVIALGFMSVLYFQNSKMNRTSELNRVPFLILIVTMSLLGISITAGLSVLILTALMSASMLGVVYAYRKDYRRSFYY